MCARILVAGGNGFIGSAICRMAAEAGHDVLSLSRHGRPDGDAPWLDQVDWIDGNILAPEEWRDRIDGCDAVIHAIGLDREHPDEGLTYERVYRDSVEMLAWEAEHAGVERFVCVSSSTKPPFTSDRYIEAKREGEARLRGRGFREAILRPAYVYGPEQPASMVIGGMMKTIVAVPGLRRTLRSWRPLHVEQVATAALRAATEEGFEGVIETDNIAYLADGHARQAAQHDGAARAPGATRRLRLPRVPMRAVALGAGTAIVLGGLAYAAVTQRHRLRPLVQRKRLAAGVHRLRGIVPYPAPKPRGLRRVLSWM